MAYPTRWIVWTILIAALHLAPASADVIRLKSGGEIRGEFERDQNTAADPLTIQTLTGGFITVSQSAIEFVSRRPRVVEEYETRRKLIPNDVESHLELAEWCRQNGLRREREAHLEAVIEIDPEHVAAHRSLGHIQHDGEWTTRDEMMTSQGYVKYKGRYIFPQELELIEQTTEQIAQERSWFKKINLWHGWLLGIHDQRRIEAFGELQKIDDPHAVPALVRNFQNEPNEQARRLYVDLLAKLGGNKAISALVYQSLEDPSSENRRAALDGIPESGRPSAIPFYLKALKSDLNQIVTRAGAALGEIGDEQIVPSLIDALVTTHRYRIRVLDNSQTIGFNANGQSSGGVVLPPEIEGMLLTGQLPYGVQYQDLSPSTAKVRTVVVKHNHQNAEVLAALEHLTGENFGYDERTWRLWWNARNNS